MNSTRAADTSTQAVSPEFMRPPRSRAAACGPPDRRASASRIRAGTISPEHGSPVRTGLRGWAGSPRPSNLIRVMPAQGGVAHVRQATDTTAVGRLHVIVNVTPDATARPQPIELARQALAGGAPLLQLRAKELSDRDVFDVAVRMTALCVEHEATLIVDDRVDVALAAGAHGVHVGADDLPVRQAR